MFVLDASITMRWFFEAGSHAHADAVLEALAAYSDTAIVPTIWLYEVSSVLARAQSKGISSPEDVAEFLDDPGHLPIQTDNDSRIFEHIHFVATTYRLTTYDAAYLELAQRRRLPLASLDHELIAACELAGVSLSPSSEPSALDQKWKLRCQSACKPGSVRPDALRHRT